MVQTVRKPGQAPSGPDVHWGFVNICYDTQVYPRGHHC